MPHIWPSSAGGGATAKRDLFCNWQYNLPPTVVGQFGGMWQVPYDGASSLVFNLTRAYFRLEVAPTVAYTVTIDKSAPGGAFSGVVVATLTVTAGTHEVTVTSFGGATVSSGDLVAVFFTAIGSVGGGGSITTVTLGGQQQ